MFTMKFLNQNDAKIGSCAIKAVSLEDAESQAVALCAYSGWMFLTIENL